VGLGVCIWHGDVPRQRFAPSPWKKCDSIRSFAILSYYYYYYRVKLHHSICGHDTIAIYPQDGGESQLATKFCHCHPKYSAMANFVTSLTASAKEVWTGGPMWLGKDLFNDITYLLQSKPHWSSHLAEPFPAYDGYVLNSHNKHSERCYITTLDKLLLSQRRPTMTQMGHAALFSENLTFSILSIWLYIQHLSFTFTRGFIQHPQGVVNSTPGKIIHPLEFVWLSSCEGVDTN